MNDLEARFRRAMDALTNAAFAYEDDELIKLCDELDPIEGLEASEAADAVDPQAASTGVHSTDKCGRSCRWESRRGPTRVR